MSKFHAPTVRLAGFPVASLDKEGFLDLCKRLIAEKGKCWVVTLNLEMVSRCRLDKGYRDLLMQADLFIADGMPLVWGSKLKRGVSRLPVRLNGSELTEELLKFLPPSRVAIIGGVDPRAALEKLGIENANDAYIFSERIQASEERARQFAAELKRRESQVVFLALGVPKQDRLALLLRERIEEGLIIGVGGTFELISGQTKRAPDWMRNSGFEWLHRLFHEPKRLAHRYLVLYWAGGFALAGDIAKSWFVKPDSST